jgi:opacity protein-like surface antigen
MRKCVLAALLAASVPASLSAQTPQPSPTASQPPYPAPAKWFGHLHGGAQVGSQDLGRSLDFQLYEETARFETRQSAGGGGLFDIGGAARLYRNYGIGMSYAQFTSSDDSAFSGTLPHPLFFDQPRAFGGGAASEHKERALHTQAMVFIPFTDKVDFTVGIGPSFFTVEQSFVRSFSFSETPPDFNAVTIDSVEVVTVKESGVGFNLGAGMTYALTRHIGASAMLRYSRGSLTFDLGSGQTVEGDAGGFQFGVGVGVRF